MGAKGSGARVKPPKPPKSKCCVSKPRCTRCPIRMLKDGTLPEGYGVKKRRLVKLDPDAPDLVRPGKGKKKTKKKDKAGKGSAKKSGKRLDPAA